MKTKTLIMIMSMFCVTHLSAQNNLVNYNNPITQVTEGKITNTVLLPNTALILQKSVYDFLDSARHTRLFSPRISYPGYIGVNYGAIPNGSKFAWYDDTSASMHLSAISSINLSLFNNDANFVSNTSLSSTLANYATNSSLTAGLATKFNIPSGNSNQYLNGLGVPTLFPTIPNNTNQLTNGAGFISTEIDPSVPSYIKAISTGDINNWNGKFNSPTGTSLQYIDGSGALQTFPSIPPAQINSDWNSISGLSLILNKPTTLSAFTDNVGYMKKSDSTTLYYTRYDIDTMRNRINSSLISLAASINLYSPSLNFSPGRSLNTNFTASTSKTVLGVYTINCTTTNPLLVGTSTADVYAEYSTNGGTTWNSISRNGTISGVGITVTLQLQTGGSGVLVVPMPANSLVRLRSVTAGTANVNLLSQVELTF